MCHSLAFSDYLCMKVWECPFITVNGDLSMCPMAYYNVDVKYGNVFDEEFAALWNCGAIKDHRRELNGGGMDVCRQCPGMKMRDEIVVARHRNGGARGANLP